MAMNWEIINKQFLDNLLNLPDENKDNIAISTFFDIESKSSAISPASFKLTDNSMRLLQESARILRFGGLLFVYGIPHQLTHFGQYLSFLRDEKMQMIFKYWISLEIDDTPRKRH